MTTAAPPLLDTAEECARWLRIDVRTIRMWGRRGTVPVHDGELFVMAEVAAYVDKRDATGRPVKRRGPLASATRSCNTAA